jgi:hypothetical protein
MANTTGDVSRTPCRPALMKVVVLTAVEHPPPGLTIGDPLVEPEDSFLISDVQEPDPPSAGPAGNSAAGAHLNFFDSAQWVYAGGRPGFEGHERSIGRAVGWSSTAGRPRRTRSRPLNVHYRPSSPTPPSYNRSHHEPWAAGTPKKVEVTNRRDPP